MPLIGIIWFALILGSPSVTLAPAGFARAEASQVVEAELPVLVRETQPEAVLVPKKAYSDRLECYCVKWLREFKGVDIRGDASTIKPNSIPVVGGVVLLRYKGSSHAAYIEKMTDEGFVISDANYTPCAVSLRTLPYNDSHIYGFYYPE